ncbi:MAG TPA: TIGR02302 family protein [Xanthobacteraceae bacterium]|nr:TIGR02302 family protein [Xanthobacteraceae bacterium]
MTDQTLPKPSPDRAGAETSPHTLLAAAVRRARWTILWERLWPVLATLLTAVGLFLALSWLGLWLWLPPLARAIGLLGFAVATVAALVPLGLLRMPLLSEGLSRLDRGSGLRHRPATAIADALAVTVKDPYSLALWNAHVARASVAAGALTPGAPSPRVAGRDPYALRALVLLACVATFFAAGGERFKRIAAAFDWQGVVLPANFRVDAWVVPPAYTGKAPIMLPGIHPGEVAAAQTPGDGPFAVPVNSTLIVRSTGNVSLDVSGSGGVTPSKEAGQAPAGTLEHRFTIAATGVATLRGAGEDLAWPFNAIPDNPPTIALTKDPQVQNRGSLLLSYRLQDDYGVTAAEATFARKDAPPSAGDKPAAPPHPLYGPPDFPLVLPQARTKSGTGQTIKDLTDHPWAGAQVTMTLVAHDDGGNVGSSDPVTFRLPQRVFVKPLARALIEQRRDLAMDANTRPRVITALDALAIAPEKFTPDAGLYLGLRSVFWLLVRAKSDDDMRHVVTRLWQMAVDIEDGDVSDAQAALRNGENALQEALQRGASDDEIRQLTDKLREAMQRYMQALAEQLRNHQQLSRPLGPNTKVITQRDLQNMLDRLQNLAKSGAKDAAQAMLQQLEQMMENMQMASPDMNGGDSQDMSELDELGDMIRQQQDLRDRTFKQGQNQQNAQRGQQGKPGQSQHPGDSLGALQQNQQALRDRLNQLLQDLKNRGLGQSQQGQQGQDGQQGQQGQGSGQGGQDQLGELGRAGSAMGEAEGELGQGNTDSAVDSQGRALDALRKGAQSLAQSMQQQMGQGQGQGQGLGRFGEARGDNDTDPLGRPLRGRDYDDSSVKVPGEIDVQRARRIIEELRKRYGDMARPQEELDYIERLLKGY